MLQVLDAPINEFNSRKNCLRFKENVSVSEVKEQKEEKVLIVCLF